MGNKTKHEDFVYFSKRVQHWVKAFSLGEYEVMVTHKNLADSDDPTTKNSLAIVAIDLLGRGAEISLARDWGMDSINKKDLDKTALHEVLHLLLYEFHEGVRDRLPQAVLEAMEHSIVRRIENFLLGPTK